MAENSAKLWFQQKANQLAINRIAQAIENQGYALPCHVVNVSGAVVTVAFDVQNSPQSLPNITIPKAESPWIRMPTQVGDKGVTMPADVYLGGVSGIGGGTATMTRRGNLSTLVFVPVSNVGSPPIDQNAAQVQGPNGAIIRTTTGTTSEVVTDGNGTTITYGDVSFTVNAVGITITIGVQSFTWDASGVNFPVPITAPDVYLPNGAVNPHTHPVTTAPGETGTMTG
jgi:hypothetical protein